jgi:hypothetical protein
MRDGLDPFDLLIHFRFQAFLSLLSEQVQAAHNLKLVGFWPLCCLWAQRPIGEGCDGRKRVFIWVSFDQGICDSPSRNTARTFGNFSATRIV